MISSLPLPHSQKTAIGAREGDARRFEDRLAANLQEWMTQNFEKAKNVKSSKCFTFLEKSDFVPTDHLILRFSHLCKGGE